MAAPRRFALIACEILQRELCLCVARSPGIVDLVLLPKGLHDQGKPRMSARLQEAIDAVDAGRHEAILLGYGLCNNGIEGLRARLPLVVPRAHDCITLLLGSKERYAAYFDGHPGTYFKSPGWIERSGGELAPGADNIPTQLGLSWDREALVAKYGEEKAAFLMETMAGWTKTYSTMAYIDTGVGDAASLKARTREEAARLGWTYEELPGSLALLQRLVDGAWDPKDFLVVPPGQTIRPKLGEQIVMAV